MYGKQVAQEHIRRHSGYKLKKFYQLKLTFLNNPTTCPNVPCIHCPLNYIRAKGKSTHRLIMPCLWNTMCDVFTDKVDDPKLMLEELTEYFDTLRDYLYPNEKKEQSNE